MVIGAPSGIKLCELLGERVVIPAGLLLVAGALGLLATTSMESGYGLVAVFLSIAGLGMGLAMAPATEAVMGSLPKDKAGVGSAVNDTTRQVGGALGVAILGSILSSAYGSRLTEGLAGQAVPEARGTAWPVRWAWPPSCRRTPGPPWPPPPRKRSCTAWTSRSRSGRASSLLGAVLSFLLLPKRAETPPEIEELEEIEDETLVLIDA